MCQLRLFIYSMLVLEPNPNQPELYHQKLIELACSIKITD